MLLWAGIILLLCGLACFAIDRRATHFFHASIPRSIEQALHATTDWAKGAHWLLGSVIAYAVASVAEWRLGHSWPSDLAARTSLAFLASLIAASIILHSVKIVLGRRRPRDELELDLYGFRPFDFDLRSDSFPSGHALTIFCVAVVLSAALPQLALVWFALAAWLALTRALLNSHYLSDVFVGAGLAVIITREVLLRLFPALVQPWF